jgi:hypothetical protein
MAFDILSIPGMSAEVERVFSSAKKLITEERNRLGSDSVEACEIQKLNLQQGVFTYGLGDYGLVEEGIKDNFVSAVMDQVITTP